MSSLRFVLGRAGTGKTDFCLNEVTGELRAGGEEGPPLIILTPEQGSFQMERALLERVPSGVTARARVMSFRRLTRMVLLDTGMQPGRILGELGRRMALRSILMKKARELTIFAATGTKSGFIHRLAGSLAEMRAYRIDAGHLDLQRRLLEEEGRGGGLLAMKLRDLALVDRAYRAYLDETGLTDPDDLMNIAARRLHMADKLKGASVWVDGFAGFTPQEYSMLEALMAEARRMTVALLIDSRISPGRRPEPTDLFFPTHETYLKLTEIARESGTFIEPEVSLDGKVPHRFVNSPLLARLESAWFRTAAPRGGQNREKRAAPGEQTDEREKAGRRPPGGQRAQTGEGAAPEGGDRPEGQPAGSPRSIRLVEAADPRHEVELTAREINRLCREEGYRFRDISVVVRNFAGYDDLISQVFDEHGIPHFIDQKEPLVHHPLMELVQAAADASSGSWTYGPLFRYLKSDLSPLSRSEVDRLENYVLAHGISGYLWTAEEPWRFVRQYSLEDDPEIARERLKDDLDAIDASRRRAAGPLAGLIRRMREHGAREGRTKPESGADSAGDPGGTGAGTVPARRFITALYEFLEELKVRRKLEVWSDEARLRGDLVEAETHRQAWDRLMEVFDEMADALGDESMEIKELAEILGAGLEGLRLGLVPPALDQVLVGSVERSRHPGVAATFVLGANEGRFPMPAPEDVILNDGEREALAAAGLELGPDSRRRLFQERYLAYVALTRPRERLSISWCRFDASGKDLMPSEIPAMVKRIIPGLTVEKPSASSEDPLDAPHVRGLAGFSVRALRRARQGEPLENRWLAIYRWLAGTTDRREKSRPILAALGEPRAAEPLPREMLDRLYGDTLLTSVSRLENFAACPFRHFAAHTLRLEDRPRYRVSAPEMGVLMHALLRRFVQRIIDEGIDWASMEPGDVEALTDEVLDDLIPRLQNEILLSTARYRHLARRVRRTADWVLFLLGEHARHSAFQPKALELSFGLAPAPGADTPEETGEGTEAPPPLPPYTIPLGDGRRVQLRGQIDRVDAARLPYDPPHAGYPHAPAARGHEDPGEDARPDTGEGAGAGAGAAAGLGAGGNTRVDTGGGTGPEDGRTLWIRVTDYKRTAPQLPLADIYYGLSLQLLVYMMVALESAPEWLGERGYPAGVFYFGTREPLLKFDGPVDGEEALRRRMNDARLNGLMQQVPEIMQAMDTRLAPGVPSPLIRGALTKGGRPYRGGYGVEPDEFSLLLETARQNVAALARDIMDGRIEARPYRKWDKSVPCTFCDFKSVCRFEASAGHKYRHLHRISTVEDFRAALPGRREAGDDVE